MRHHLLLLTTSLLSIEAYAQECAGGRYIDAGVFSAVTTTNAVVSSSILILTLNYIITELFFGT